MKTYRETLWGWLFRKIRAQFILGIIVAVPIGVTIWILVWIFSTIDNVLQPVIGKVWPDIVPGVGFVVTIVLIYLVGVIASNVAGKWLIHYSEGVVTRVPVVGQLYVGIKEILHSLSQPSGTGFMQVVLVEFPRKGMKAIGFITNELHDKSGEKLFSIFIPTAPNPTTGFLQLMGENEIIRTKISIDVALKMIVSAGRMTPKEVGDRLSANN